MPLAEQPSGPHNWWRSGTEPHQRADEGRHGREAGQWEEGGSIPYRYELAEDEVTRLLNAKEQRIIARLRQMRGRGMSPIEEVIVAGHYWEV